MPLKKYNLPSPVVELLDDQESTFVDVLNECKEVQLHAFLIYCAPKNNIMTSKYLDKG